jgi:hypothetical protein
MRSLASHVDCTTLCTLFLLFYLPLTVSLCTNVHSILPRYFSACFPPRLPISEVRYRDYCSLNGLLVWKGKRSAFTHIFSFVIPLIFWISYSALTAINELHTGCYFWFHGDESRQNVLLLRHTISQIVAPWKTAIRVQKKYSYKPGIYIP